MPKKREFLRVGELAKATGLSTDTLHHYERKGVLASPHRSSNGYREYPVAALGRVRLVQQALAAGFTLDQLARVLAVRDNGGAPCRKVRSIAAARLADVEQQLRELTTMRNQLRGTLKTWDSRLSETTPGERAELLEQLADLRPLSNKNSRAATPQWRRRKERIRNNEKP